MWDETYPNYVDYRLIMTAAWLPHKCHEFKRDYTVTLEQSWLIGMFQSWAHNHSNNFDLIHYSSVVRNEIFHRLLKKKIAVPFQNGGKSGMYWIHDKRFRYVWLTPSMWTFRLIPSSRFKCERVTNIPPLYTTVVANKHTAHLLVSGYLGIGAQYARCRPLKNPIHSHPEESIL